jgi:DNA polymerase III subunit gamma/tau
MSYLVLARKWRPQKFDDIIGQSHISNTLKNAIKEQRVSHAFLFSGMRGIGKTTTARILAKALNCHNLVEFEPCCECPSCIEISNGNSMDVIEIDGASNNSVDDIRELRERVKFKPQRDKYKIYIIDEVHQLSNQAFNALLKTLEEPPEHIIFIFATTESHKIPQTVLSRCQRFNFRRVGGDQMKVLLKKIAKAENLTIDEESINLISWASEGSMRDAQSILDQAIAYCGDSIICSKLTEILGVIDRLFLEKIFLIIAEKKMYEIFESVDKIISEGHNLSRLNDKLIEFNRDMMIVKLTPNAQELLTISKEDYERLSQIAEKFTVMQLQQFHRIFVESDYEIKKSSQPRIEVEMMLLRLTMVEKVISIKELIEKVESITKNIKNDPQRILKSSEPIQRNVIDNIKVYTDQATKSSRDKEFSEELNQVEKLEKKSTDVELKMKFLEKISSQMHCSMFKDASVILSDGKVTLYYDDNENSKISYEASISDEDFKKDIEQIALSITGKSHKLICRLKGSESEENIEEIKHQEIKPEEDLPLIVQKALDIFNGEIVNR